MCDDNDIPCKVCAKRKENGKRGTAAAVMCVVMMEYFVLRTSSRGIPVSYGGLHIRRGMFIEIICLSPLHTGFRGQLQSTPNCCNEKVRREQQQTAEVLGLLCTEYDTSSSSGVVAVISLDEIFSLFSGAEFLAYRVLPLLMGCLACPMGGDADSLWIGFRIESHYCCRLLC